MTARPGSGTVALLLDTTRGERHLDTTVSAPMSLRVVEPRRTVLDWVLHALDEAGIARRIYVGGYHIQKVMESYPDLDFRYHRGWAETGELAALGLVPFDPACDHLIIRASTVVMPGALAALLASDGTVTRGVYTDGVGSAFAGVVALPAPLVTAAVALARSLAEAEPTADIERWLDALAPAGLAERAVALDGLAAPVTDKQAVARTVFQGKGRTLEQVRPLLRSATVLGQRRFGLDDWARDPAGLVAELQSSFGASHLVVRSSTRSEDGHLDSGAGRFASVLDVAAGDAAAVRAAVETVIESYRRDGRAVDDRDEVLVQPQIRALAASGVLLTRDLETGAPYYVINVDRGSGRSDTVTAGARAFHSVYVARDADVSGQSADVTACVRLARELETLTHLDALDIEFGIDRDGMTYLFQVRPIASRARKFELADDELRSQLGQLQAYLEDSMAPRPSLSGRRTVFGNMPDWNPAEMIGTTPRPLALSLYQRLIGNAAWAEARATMGYRDVRSVPLIVSLGGRPYVDVRASLNSFLPAGTDDALAERWVDHCIALLERDPALHDKIEFELAITCLAFDFDTHARRLRDAGLDAPSVDAFRGGLLTLTDRLLRGQVAAVAPALELLGTLERRRQAWLQRDRTGFPALARRAAALLADCERFGTVPFSILARNGFVAMTLLRSLCARGVLTDAEYDLVGRSIPTVASELSRDLGRYRQGNLDRATLLARYGHLRPSSYDLTSPNYRSAADLYFGPAEGQAPTAAFPALDQAREVFARHRAEIDRLLDTTGFRATSTDLEAFVLASIPAREQAKFEFMKTVDTILETVAEIGDELGFSRDEMAFVPVSLIERGATDSASAALRAEFRREIGFQQKRWNLTCALRLPHLVRRPDDVLAFEVTTCVPNFISTRRVTAPVAVLDAGAPPGSLEGRIVLIQAADPGYDWVFGHAIAGLITEFGGAASHMAIRAAEFGLPAAIGCGDAVFEPLRNARLIELDCASKRIQAHY